MSMDRDHCGHAEPCRLGPYMRCCGAPRDRQRSTYLISASDDNTIRVWDADKGWQECCKREAHDKSVTLLAICGQHIVSCSDDQKLRVWRCQGGVAGGGELSCLSTHRLQSPSSAVASTMLEHGGAIAVTGNFVGEVFVWES